MHMLYVKCNSINTKVAQANHCKVPDLTQAVQKRQSILSQTDSLEKKVKAFHIINLQNLRERVLKGSVPHPHNLC